MSGFPNFKTRRCEPPKGVKQSHRTRRAGWLLFAFALLITSPADAKKKTAVDVLKEKATELMTAPPRDLEVCFSPEGECDIKLWKFIQSAKQSVDIAVFDITHPKIVHEILVASKRLPVRIVVDRRQGKGEHSLVSTLIKAGAQVRFGKQRGIMHNKFTIVDGAMLQTGSFNYTVGASDKNNENQVYLATPSIVQAFQQRFQILWESGFPAAEKVSAN